MKRVFRKNQIVVAALALMIAAAGYLNYTYENDEKEIATMATKNEKQDEKKTKKTASLTEEEILQVSYLEPYLFSWLVSLDVGLRVLLLPP